MAIPWILISILIVLILALVLFIFFFKDHKRRAPPDYYAFFLIGLVWLAAGIIGVFRNESTFFIIGLAFALIGLAHKKEWKQNRKNWADMGKKERRITAIIMIILLIAVLAGMIVFLLFEKGVI
ncbi:hypothetical protein JW756_03770 [Candidatus Woesearchaeota archaeon]|nr:hypothetical protein [Candidatus Woesearchaeota archaeon]